MDGIELDPATVETNILIFRLEAMPAADFTAGIGERGVQALQAGPDLVRFVTHRDVDDTDVDAAIAAIESELRNGEGRR